MPAESTIYLWLSKHPEFMELYTRAREAWAEAQVEQILNIARDGSNDTYTDEEGNEKTNHEVIARSKLHVDTLRWVMTRMATRRFGEKSSVDVTNSDGSLTKALENPADVIARLDAIYAKATQKMLADANVTDAVFEEVSYPEDGSDLC